MAYETCYKDGAAPGVELVYMSELRAGDHVLTAEASGALSVTRVLVNQHSGSGAYAPASSRILTLALDNGASISLTSDHALYVNGALVAASSAVQGSTLVMALGQNVKVTRAKDAALVQVVNPVTVAGTVLASDASSAHQGRAVLAASHPIWVAEQFVSGQISLPLSTALSSAFPLTTQAYYDSVVEPIGAMWTQSLVSLSARAPHWALVATTFATDVLLVAGMGFFALVVCSKAFIICAAVAALGRRLASPRKQSC